MDKKEQARLRKQRQRDKERDKILQNVTLSVTEQAEDVTQDVTHPVMKWLVPGERREKLEKIVKSVGRFRQLPNVYLGCGVHSLPLDIVSDLLEATV